MICEEAAEPMLAEGAEGHIPIKSMSRACLKSKTSIGKVAYLLSLTRQLWPCSWQ